MPTTEQLSAAIAAAESDVARTARDLAEAEYASELAEGRLKDAQVKYAALRERRQSCHSAIAELRAKSKERALAETEAAKLNIAILDSQDLTHLTDTVRAELSGLAEQARQRKAEEGRSRLTLDEATRMLRFRHAQMRVAAAEQALCRELAAANEIAYGGASSLSVGTFGSWGATNEALYSVYRHGQAPAQRSADRAERAT